MKANALTLEQSFKLLPATRLSSNGKQVKTPMGVVAFHQSSTLKNSGWRTSNNEEELSNGIDYVLFALGYEGGLILPQDVLTSFSEQNYPS